MAEGCRQSAPNERKKTKEEQIQLPRIQHSALHESAIPYRSQTRKEQIQKNGRRNGGRLKLA